LDFVVGELDAEVIFEAAEEFEAWRLSMRAFEEIVVGARESAGT